MSHEDLKSFMRRVRKKIRTPSATSSFPFISGDTFKLYCDLIYVKGALKMQFEQLLRANKPNALFFIDVPNFEHFLNELRTLPEKFFSTFILVIHNGDFSPNVEVFRYLRQFFRGIYSVNWIGDLQLAKPLPIGLENFTYLRNGIPKDFVNDQKKRVPWHARKITYLSSFNLETNIETRIFASKQLANLDGVLRFRNFVNPKLHRTLLAKSKFVVSPPGNGSDCHRTWEAIYLGCIPIVLKDSWPFSHLELPILALETWSDLYFIDQLTIPNAWALTDVHKKFYEYFIKDFDFVS